MPHIKEAIVLAGGFGTRLQAVVNDVPKPMAPINDTPFLAYLMEYLIQQGIERVILSVGYKYDLIQSYFGFQYKGLHIKYALENEPLGTGGAIKLATKYCCQEQVLVLNGDTFFKVDFEKLAQCHFDAGACITLAARQMQDFDRYGTIEFDEQHIITAFKEKQPVEEGYINGGVYVLDVHFLQFLPLEDKFSFEKEVLEAYYQHENYRMAACPFNERNYFIDIGIPTDYEKAQDELPNLISISSTPPNAAFSSPPVSTMARLKRFFMAS